MKLTLKETYQYCRDLWQWLYDNPTKRKRDWPEFQRGGKFSDINTPMSQCFACEYVVVSASHNNCFECPLLEVWLTDKEIDEAEFTENFEPCQDGLSSPFHSYRQKSNIPVEKYKEDIKRIVDFCDMKLTEGEG